MNKKLILIPLILIGGAIFLGISAGFMLVDSTSVEASETDEFQDNVELVQNEQKEGKDFYVEIQDGVGSSDSLN